MPVGPLIATVIAFSHYIGTSSSADRLNNANYVRTHSDRDLYSWNDVQCSLTAPYICELTGGLQQVLPVPRHASDTAWFSWCLRVPVVRVIAEQLYVCCVKLTAGKQQRPPMNVHVQHGMAGQGLLSPLLPQ
jgi:hypothetical protein